MQDLRRLFNQPGFPMVITGREKVKPFPGRFPTRWKILFNGTGIDKSKTFDYFGKPNRDIAMMLSWLLPRHAGLFQAWEFDRLGAFRYGYLSTPKNYAKVTAKSSAVCYFYYPFHTTSSDFFAPWVTGKVFPKWMILDRKFAIYTPYERMLQDENQRAVPAGAEEVPGLVKKNKTVEIIDLRRLPKSIVPPRQYVAFINGRFRCSHCGEPFLPAWRLERDQEVTCADCGRSNWVVY